MAEENKLIKRDQPDPAEARKALVNQWVERVQEAHKHWEDRGFKTMKQDMDFAEGYQIDGQNADEADEYVANITLKHINDRVAELYAKNPRARAKRVPRMESPVWDGTAESVMEVDQRMAMAVEAGAEPAPEDLQFLAEVANVLERRKMIDGIGKTLEILFHYFLREGIPPFKIQAKQLVRRVETCGVGYLKLGFQRVMEPNTEIEEKLADFSRQLEHIERLAKDLADDEIDEADAEAEELRNAIQVMQTQVNVIAREGLVFDFPDSTAIVPAKSCKHIRGFIGAPWIAELHEVETDEIKERFSVDVGTNYTAYKEKEPGSTDKPKCRWWEIYDLETNVLMHLVEGYSDFLEEPKAPPVYVEQGHPYFALTFNNLESRKTCFPPSDVRLMRPMQKEYNRKRESIRKHRIANRPAYIALKAMLDEEDLHKFESHADNEIIEIALSPGQGKVGDVITGKPTVPIDPNLYIVEDTFIDIQRTTGRQEANFGGTSNATATESAISESGRMSGVSSNVDDLDDFLTAVARASGQLMLAEMSPEIVKRIAGEGAVWPELSRTEIAEEIFLEIKAGSSGRPNKAQELANLDRVAPFLLQLPGLPPKWLANLMLERMDESIDIDEVYVENLPSIQAMNAMSKAVMPAPGPGPANRQPEQQGAQGADNAPRPPETAPGPQPGFPAPAQNPVVQSIMNRSQGGM